jgi:hypothetical protein
MTSRVTINDQTWTSDGSLDVRQDGAGNTTAVETPAPEFNSVTLAARAVELLVQYLKECKEKGVEP